VLIEGATNGNADSGRALTGKRWEHVSKDVASMKKTIEAVKGFDKTIEMRDPEDNSGTDVMMEDVCDANNSLQQVILNLHGLFNFDCVKSVC
jgi:hypothetical protein